MAGLAGIIERAEAAHWQNHARQAQTEELESRLAKVEARLAHEIVAREAAERRLDNLMVMLVKSGIVEESA